MYEGADRREYGEDNLTPMQIFNMVFHPQKGAVAAINGTIEDLCKEMRSLEKNLKKYNGLPERMLKIEEAVGEQVKFCKQVQDNVKTNTAVEAALEDAREKGAKEQQDNFNKAILVWGKILVTITVLTGFITWFLDLWTF
jgi:DNA repair exonuclease SbcCD ATPase subunit